MSKSNLIKLTTTPQRKPFEVSYSLKNDGTRYQNITRNANTADWNDANVINFATFAAPVVTDEFSMLDSSDSSFVIPATAEYEIDILLPVEDNGGNATEATVLLGLVGAIDPVITQGVDTLGDAHHGAVAIKWQQEFNEGDKLQLRSYHLNNEYVHLTGASIKIKEVTKQVMVPPTEFKDPDLGFATYAVDRTHGTPFCVFDVEIGAYNSPCSLGDFGIITINKKGVYCLDLIAGIGTTNPEVEVQVNDQTIHTYKDGSTSQRERRMYLELNEGDFIRVQKDPADTSNWFAETGGFENDTNASRITVLKLG